MFYLQNMLFHTKIEIVPQKKNQNQIKSIKINMGLIHKINHQKYLKKKSKSNQINKNQYGFDSKNQLHFLVDYRYQINRYQ